MKCLALASSLLAGELGMASVVTSLFYNMKEIRGPCPAACPEVGRASVLSDMMTCSTQMAESYPKCEFEGYIQLIGSVVPPCSAISDSVMISALDMMPLRTPAVTRKTILPDAYIVAEFQEPTRRACLVYAASTAPASPELTCGLNPPAVLQTEPFATVEPNASSWNIMAHTLLVEDGLQAPAFVMPSPLSCGGAVSGLNYHGMRMNFTAAVESGASIPSAADGLDILLSAKIILLSLIATSW